MASNFNSSDAPRWKHHVFLSFSGDTCFKFSDHLYHALLKKGIHVFRDEGGLETGNEISPHLLETIEESRISIIVLSKNYASSSWCLDELVKILACKKAKRQIILPLFYDVDPTEVRHQTGSIGKAMSVHEQSFSDNPQKVQEWRSALRQVANLAGESCRNNRYESQFIEKIIQKISNILHISENPVGLVSRKLEVVSLQKFQNLTSLSISHCRWVKEVPDVSAMPHLTELNLDFCYNLIKIHDSVGFLHKLKTLSAMGCFKLRAFPTSNRLNCLELVNFNGCRSIQKLPIMSQPKALAKLDLSDTGIDVESATMPQLLEESNYPIIVLPGVKIPRCFHHSTDRPYISFGIRKEFPTISISFAMSPNENLCVEFYISIGRFKAFFCRGYSLRKSSCVHIFRLPDVLKHEDYQRLQAEIQQKWLRVEVGVAKVNNNPLTESFKDETAVGNAKEENAQMNLPVSCNRNSSMASGIFDVNIPVVHPQEEEAKLSSQMLPPKATNVTVESSTDMSGQPMSVWPMVDKSKTLQQGSVNMPSDEGKKKKERKFCINYFNLLKKLVGLGEETWGGVQKLEGLEEETWGGVHLDGIILDNETSLCGIILDKPRDRDRDRNRDRDRVEPPGTIFNIPRVCKDETLVSIIKECGVYVHEGGSNANIRFVVSYNRDSTTCSRQF